MIDVTLYFVFSCQPSLIMFFILRFCKKPKTAATGFMNGQERTILVVGNFVPMEPVSEYNLWPVTDKKKSQYEM